MESQAQAFMKIIGAAISGIPADPDCIGSQPAQLVALAAKQHLLPLFYEAIHTLPQAATLSPEVGATVRRQVMGQAMSTEALLALYRQLELLELRPLVVKGFVCRSLYPQGDHRPSSDEDLWVQDADFPRCCQALEQLGYVTEDPVDRFERTYRSPKTGLRIELHRQLFDPDSPVYGSWNRFFADGHQQPAFVSGLPTLSPTLHLLYLLLHAFKHFLHSGFGVRQVCDIVLFAQKYADAIRWQTIEDALVQLRADGFAGAVFLLGQQFWGIPAPFVRDVDPMPLLEDLMQAGIYGGSSMERKRSSNITLSAAAGKTAGRRLSALFPPRSSLTGRFPYLKKHPCLLPWAWLCRIFTYKNNRTTQSLQIGAQRLALLRLYGVIEK